MKRFLKIFFSIIGLVFVLFQLYPKPKRNLSGVTEVNDVSRFHHIPGDVQQVLKTSCYDCHSNNTVYPWYANLQPIAIWLDDHVKEGKKELNFSEFGAFSTRKKYRKLEEIQEMINEGEMPLKSYTLIHQDAVLSNEQKQAVINWSSILLDSFKANYPVDSLIRKK